MINNEEHEESIRQSIELVTKINQVCEGYNICIAIDCLLTVCVRNFTFCVEGSGKGTFADLISGITRAHSFYRKQYLEEQHGQANAQSDKENANGRRPVKKRPAKARRKDVTEG